MVFAIWEHGICDEDIALKFVVNHLTEEQKKFLELLHNHSISESGEDFGTDADFQKWYAEKLKNKCVKCGHMREVKDIFN